MYTVSVRELCAFTGKSGDLDLRFTPSPTAQEGVAGHKIVAARRPGTWLSEVPLSGGFETLWVRGRADGLDPGAARLEEVKTCRGGPERVPENHRALHWAQAETYAHLHCSDKALAAMTVSLAYFDIASQQLSTMDRILDAAALRRLFEDRCRRFASWAASESAHREARDRALAGLTFAHASFRPGQRELAEAVFRGAAEGRCVLAQAPTGIGKTVGTLFPALKALAARGLDKVFFLTARTSGRQVALDGLRTISAGRDLPLRVIELVAREQACEQPGKACHGESCTLAKGFYDRLPAARQAAVADNLLDRDRVRAVAREHGICPYYLGQELVKWSDVVVGDYNHYFDTSAMLHGLAQAHEWRVLVLVDEAHNLVERGRAMFSASLSRHELRGVARSAPAAFKHALDSLGRAWNELVGTAPEPYRALEHLPGRVMERLEAALVAIAAFQADQPQALDPRTLQLFFDLGRFNRLASSFGTHSIVDISFGSMPGAGPGEDARLSIRNVVPAAHLAARLGAARSVTLFSATLAPTGFYREMLGLPARTVAIEVGSPFSGSQLQVRTAHDISTRFGDRAASLAPIAALIAAQYDAAPGNYIAFFSSFDYLEQAAAEFVRLRPEVPVWRQTARMNDAEQRAFLARFRPEGRGLGFAVLGGRFAEGVDLPGRRLVGAFVATLGLPQVNPVNEAIREHMERQFAGQGYEYTYLYPGLRKVVQAAGRVIRTASDRGVVHLIDDRFGTPRVRALLPRWWSLQESADPGADPGKSARDSIRMRPRAQIVAPPAASGDEAHVSSAHLTLVEGQVSTT